MLQHYRLDQYLLTLKLDGVAVRESLPDGLRLRLQDDALSIESLSDGLSLFIDFFSGSIAHRMAQHLGAENLIKACRIKGQARGDVLDATAGLGRDAFLLAKSGFCVTATEREPVVYALLKNALDRYCLKTGENPPMELIQCSAEQQMNQHHYDVIYFDPMFPKRDKNAKIKKDMQILQLLLADKPVNYQPVLEAALCSAKKLVIKRPRRADLLLSRQPTYQLIGKACRYDVYQLN